MITFVIATVVAINDENYCLDCVNVSGFYLFVCGDDYGFQCSCS